MYLESKRKVGLTSVLDIKELNDYSSLSRDDRAPKGSMLMIKLDCE